MPNHPQPENSRILKICNLRGLHARASAKFVQVAESFDANVLVSKDGHVVGGTSIMGLMMLAASKGSVIHITATGAQAQLAIGALEKLVNSRFGENE